jgi:hypothetical protein
VIAPGELEDRPDLYGEAVVQIDPVAPATNTIVTCTYIGGIFTQAPPQSYTLTSSGYIMQVIPGKPDKLVSKRILCAEVTYTNVKTQPPPPLKTKGTVKVNNFYEKNR